MALSHALRRRLEPLVSARLLHLNELLASRLAAGLAEKGLTPAEFRLVGVLLTAPEGLRQRALAERLGVRPPTVSAALPKLERAGVVERVDDPEDPRAWVVRLRSTAPLLPGVEALEALDAALLRGVSRSERAQLVGLLGRLTASLEAA